MDAILGHLLVDPVDVDTPASIEAWWFAHRDRAARWGDAMDRAVAAGFAADRLGYAFAGGYDAALRALVPTLPAASPVAFCATEQGGAHPSSIETKLSAADAGYVLEGRKRWATGGTFADQLLVVATVGPGPNGRNMLKVARIDARQAGVELEAMPPTPFCPEVPHATVTLTAVSVADREILAGDGYDDYLKPFRTIEDLHVHGALLGYLVGAARRYGWPNDFVERAVATVAVVRALASADPRAAGVHVAVAGALESGRQLAEESGALWAQADEAERGRWVRDRPLLHVAAKARSARRERAWERLREAADGVPR